MESILQKGYKMQKKSKEQIARERRESFLKEILSEAFDSLQDSRLNTLEITHVECSKGRHNAKIFINNNDITSQDRKEILNIFKKAKPILKEYLLCATSWYSVPDLSIEFDDSFEKQNRLDKIFAQIHKNEKKDSNVK